MTHAVSAEEERFKKNLSQFTLQGSLLYLGRALQYAASKYGSAPALISSGVTLTYTQLYRRAVAFSQLLRLRGVQPNDRVLLYCENSIHFYIGYYAVLQIGAVIVPLNTFLHDRELMHIIDDADPRLMIASVSLRDRIADTGTLLILTQNDMPADCSDEQLADFIVDDKDPDALMALLYTSGTTGTPKGVMLSSRNCIINVIQGLSRYEPPKVGDRVFGILPLFHSFGQNICLWMAILLGCTVIVVPHIDRRSILEHIKYEPTFFLGVPALYGLMCLLRDTIAPYLGKVKLFVCGGDLLPDRIRLAFLLVYGRRIAIGYGLTEAAPIVSAAVDDAALRVGTVGTPLAGIIVVIKNEHGVNLPPGAIGELFVKGDNIMLGYYNNPEATASVLHDGWLATGDLGYIDTTGQIVITGRQKDLIIHKGFNIYPPEIENVIASYFNVIRVGVIGRQDDQAGEIVIAYVQLKNEEAGASKKLLELCRQNLAPYKVPREFICSTEPLASTATGKVDKKQLKIRDNERK